MGTVGRKRGGFDAEKEAVDGIGGAEVFVGVERGEGGCVGNREKLSGDGRSGGVEDYAGVSTEVVEGAANSSRADGRETASGGSDLRGGAVGVQSPVDEEKVGHTTLLPAKTQATTRVCQP